MLCLCTKPALYNSECRDCYEDRVRREYRDEITNCIQDTKDRLLRRERGQKNTHRTHHYNEQRIQLTEETHRRRASKVLPQEVE